MVEYKRYTIKISFTMNKQLTKTLGIALGATLLVGYGIYRLLAPKAERNTGSQRLKVSKKSIIPGYVGNSLVKGNSLYRVLGAHTELVGGGLYAANY